MALSQIDRRRVGQAQFDGVPSIAQQKISVRRADRGDAASAADLLPGTGAGAASLPDACEAVEQKLFRQPPSRFRASSTDVENEPP